MKQYFIAKDGKQTGPYSLEEVRSMSLSPDTLVWYNGMENWAKAATLPELEDLFTSDSNEPAQAPNVSNQATPEPDDECPKQHLGLAIFSAIMFPTGIAAIVKTVLIKTRWQQGRYDDARWLAKTAHKYSIMSIILGAILIALVIIYYVVIISVLLHAGRHSYYY